MLDGAKNAIFASKAGSVMTLCCVFAGLFAAASVISITSRYIRGEELGAWNVVKPMVLLALVCNFNSFVLHPTNALVNIFTRGLSEQVDINTTTYLTRMGDILIQAQKNKVFASEQQAAEAFEAIDASEYGPAGKFLRKVWETIKQFARSIFGLASLVGEGLSAGIAGIIYFIMKLVFFCQQILCFLYTTILGIMGPFVFTVGILSPYASGIKSWFARYIQISMWIPVGYLVLYVNIEFSGIITYSGYSTFGSALSAAWVVIALELVGLVSVCAVPKICAWIIDSTGANDAHGILAKIGTAAARKLL